MHHRQEINTQNKANLLYISRTKIEDSFIPSIHSHPNLELILIYEGEGKFFYDGEESSVKKGNFIIVNKNSSHYEATNGLCYYAMGFTNLEIGDKLDIRKNINIFTLNHDSFEQFLTLYDLTYKEAKNKRPHYIDFIENTVENLFVLIRRLEKVNINEAKSSKYSPIIEVACQIIENNYSKDFSINDLALRLNISPYHLCHKFSKETGYGIIEYKISCQLKESINLLNQTDMTISEIALLVGFNSTSYYTKQFKKHYNASPKQYRFLKNKRFLQGF